MYKQWLNPRIIGLSFIALFSGIGVFGQVPTKSEIAIEKVATIVDRKNVPFPVQDSIRYVSGIVVDESGEPLIAVAVQVKGTAYGVISDFEGRFKMDKPLKVGDVLVFSYLGYEDKEYEIKDYDPVNMHMEMDTTIRMVLDNSIICILGEVSVDDVYSAHGDAKKPFWKRILFFLK